ncbi:PAS domain-containing sensor histidine kinase [Gemmobacter sp. 24YEA27]|uniref:PAS domain-containing sensor histidine kinase n=1 Tax=Gemmobacter sp. 24YEA27 TaxID=3040672 RepID=UPI0024B3748F|nr:PAS domain-containing sensor histidine kinase [Gemmobacter sp. 24YEA27]
MYTEDLYRILRTGHVQLQGIVDTISDPLLVLDSALCVQAASRSFFSIFGVDRDETIGKGIYELGNGQWDIPDLRRLLTDVIPKASVIINYRVDHDFPTLGRRTMLLTARTLYHPDGANHTMLLSFADVTENVRSDVGKDLLFGEILHRMKNLLGVTESIARQMPVKGISAEEYRDAFLGRFRALVGAQQLAYSDDEDLGLEQMLERVLAPYMGGPARVVIEPGPPVDFGPRKTMTLCMVMHELATNSVKYGALSAPGGQVRIGWQVVDHGGVLKLTWAERGGPTVRTPETTGYGTKVIKAAIVYALGGTVEPSYAPDGLSIEVTIPLKESLSK